MERAPNPLLISEVLSWLIILRMGLQGMIALRIVNLDFRIGFLGMGGVMLGYGRAQFVESTIDLEKEMLMGLVH